MRRAYFTKQILLPLAAVFVCCNFLSTGKAVAAACSPSGTLGQLSATVSIPTTGEYVIWSRIKIPSASNPYYLLEVDGASCYNVGGASVPANTWTWVNYQDNAAGNTTKYTFATTGSHSIKLIGSSAGVQVDRVMFLKSGEDCTSNGSTPLGTGDNCASTVAPTVDPPVTPPGDGGSSGGDNGGSSGGGSGSNPTSDTFIPKIVADALAHPGNVSKVQYFVDGKLVQSSDQPIALDKTLLENGQHKVTTKVTYKDGHTATESSTVSVNNPTGVLPDTTRWLRLNRVKVVAPTSSLSLIAVVGSVFFGRHLLTRVRKPLSAMPVEDTSDSVVVDGVKMSLDGNSLKLFLKQAVSLSTYKNFYRRDRPDFLSLLACSAVLLVCLLILLVTFVITVIVY